MRVKMRDRHGEVKMVKLFDKVKCKGFYAKHNDGIYIALDKQNLTADLMKSETTVEEDIDRAEKTYYQHRKENFSGVIVGFTDITVQGYLDVIYDDAVDVGIGIIPEKYWIQKNAKQVEKCAIVYYANNKKHYVPLDDIVEVIKDDVSASKNHDKKRAQGDYER